MSTNTSQVVVLNDYELIQALQQSLLQPPSTPFSSLPGGGQMSKNEKQRQLGVTVMN